MRRLIVITCSFLIFFAGAASAWAECKQISFDSQGHHHSSGSTHAHDHHHSDDGHSHSTKIHCPSLEAFVPSATFSLPDRAQKLNEVIGSAVSLVSQEENLSRNDSNAHDPPFLIFSLIPAR